MPAAATLAKATACVTPLRETRFISLTVTKGKTGRGRKTLGSATEMSPIYPQMPSR